jgi:hypothetical protein
VVTNGFTPVEDDAEAGVDPTPRLAIGNGDQSDRADAGESRGEENRPRSGEDPRGGGEQKHKRSAPDASSSGSGPKRQNKNSDPKPKRAQAPDNSGSAANAKAKQTNVDDIIRNNLHVLTDLAHWLVIARDGFDYQHWTAVRGKLSKKSELSVAEAMKLFNSILRCIFGIPFRRLPEATGMRDDAKSPMGYVFFVNNDQIEFRKYDSNVDVSFPKTIIVPTHYMQGFWGSYKKHIVDTNQLLQVLEESEGKRRVQLESLVPTNRLGDWVLSWYKKRIWVTNTPENQRHKKWLDEKYPGREYPEQQKLAYGLMYTTMETFWKEVFMPCVSLWIIAPQSQDADAACIQEQLGPVITGISDGKIKTNDDTKFLFAVLAEAMKIDTSKTTARSEISDLLQKQLPPNTNKVDRQAIALYVLCAVKELQGGTATEPFRVGTVGMNP